MTERTCGTCSWKGGEHKWICHQEREPLQVYQGHWCRHWSATTGWDRFADLPTPLENQAADLLGIVAQGDTGMAVDADDWLEEYKRKC